MISVNPDQLGTEHVPAIRRALELTGKTIDQVDIFEINEGSAGQVLYTMQTLQIPEAKVNPSGGSLGLGNPLGATGLRQVVTLIHEMKRSNARLGVVSINTSTGVGMAAVIENQ